MAYIYSKKTTFETPEDDYRAVVKEIFEMNDGTLRIVFQILSLTHKAVIYLAGKNYAPGKKTLADDLCEWLGLDGVEKVLKEDGSIDVAKLKGLHADIRVVHLGDGEHDIPYSYISKITQAGRLTPDFESAA